MSLHQNIGKTIQTYVSLDSNIDSTLRSLSATQKAMAELHAQADRVQRWYGLIIASY